jgi:prevent-host-death family protein
MTDIALRDLRNNTSEVLRRVEAGEELTVTVSGRPVADLVPRRQRKQYFSAEEYLAMRDDDDLADPGLLDDLRELLADDTDDIEDPWEKAERR